MSQSNTGVGAEHEIANALIARGAYVHRLVDTKAARNHVTAGPCDFVVTYKGRTLYLEVKDCQLELPSFPFKSRMSASQRHAMALVCHNRGEFLLAVRRHDGKWFCQRENILVGLLSAGKASIRWEDMHPMPVVGELPC